MHRVNGVQEIDGYMSGRLKLHIRQVRSCQGQILVEFLMLEFPSWSNVMLGIHKSNSTWFKMNQNHSDSILSSNPSKSNSDEFLRFSKKLNRLRKKALWQFSGAQAHLSWYDNKELWKKSHFYFNNKQAGFRHCNPLNWQNFDPRDRHVMTRVIKCSTSCLRCSKPSIWKGQNDVRLC